MADETTYLADRVIELERHVAELEAVNQDLSDELAKQWNQIDKLMRTMSALNDRLEGVEEPAESQKPPHW